MAIIWAALGIALIVGWRTTTGYVFGIIWLLGAVVWLIRDRRDRPTV